MEVETFIWKFHAVDGENLVEKQKNFNSLLTNIPADHDALIELITPQNPLQELFKLKLLLKLRRLPELVEILKSDEEYLPAKLLKNKWFCQQLAVMLEQNFSGFVNNILPFTSYIIRKRIIAKLAMYGTKLDTVYDEIYSRYGIHIAKDLLTGCSSTKVANILQNHQVKLSPRQQRILYQKHPCLFMMYTKQKHSETEDSVIDYIAQCDINHFLRIMLDTKKGHLGHWGKRFTRRLLLNYKEFIIANANIFDEILHAKTVLRVLGQEDLKRFYYNYCPEDVNNFRRYNTLSYSISKNLESRLYKWLFEVFQKKYNKSLYDFPDVVDKELMENMDIEERKKWITIKRENGMSESDLIPYKKITESIPLIKSKVTATLSVRDHKNLIHLLLKTCKINNDLDALAEVFEYVCTQYRNDDIILSHFRYLLRMLNLWEKFNQRHWNSVNIILNKVDENSEFLRFDDYFKYLKFLYCKKEFSDERILNNLKYIKSGLRYCYYYVHTKEQQKVSFLKFIDVMPKSIELQKELFLKLIDLMPKLIKTDEKLEYQDLNLMALIIQWNKQHPKDKIPIFSYTRLVESFKKATQEAIERGRHTYELTCLSLVFESIICTKEQSSFRNDSINNYFLLNVYHYSLKVDRWLLKHQPNTVAEHFNKFMQHTFSNCVQDFTFLYHVAKFTDSSFQKKIVRWCLKMIATNILCTDQRLDVAFRIIARLEPPNKFLKHITPFFPKSDKIQKNKEHREKVVKAITESFKYTTSVVVLPVLISYSKGVFLRYDLESLYYLFNHSPENQLSVFVKRLSCKTASLRKHSIFLTCAVGSVDDVRQIFQHFIENEQNVAVHRDLLRAALKYFIKNPSDEFWENVKVCFTKLDKNASERFDELVNLHEFPEKYQTRYVMFVWEILKKCEDVDKNHATLLSSIPWSFFKDFPLSFLTEIISENFLKVGSDCESAINDFIISSLTKSSYKNEIMTIIFNIMKQEIISQSTSWEQKKRLQKMFSCFVDALVSNLRTEMEHYEILCIFSREWHNLFSATETINEHLKLSFVQFYLESNKDIMKFSTIITDFLENLVSVYGIVIVDVFAKELNDFLRKILCYCSDVVSIKFLKFLLHLLKNWNSLIFYLLVIKLLPSKPPSPSYKYDNELFNQIIELLRQVPQDSIQILLNLHLRNVE